MTKRLPARRLASPAAFPSAVPRPPNGPTPRSGLGRAAVLWTGGKDCTLALHLAIARGYHVRALVAFVPERENFLAHPSVVCRLQAESLGLEWRPVPISAPYRPGYEGAIRGLRADGIDTLITGDIDRVDGHSNWIRERAAPSGVRVVTPLWKRRRETLLRAIQEYRLSAIVSYALDPPLSRNWLGRPLDRSACRELLTRGSAEGFDPCGEQGEYHSIVLDAPLFASRVELRLGPIMSLEGASHLSVNGASLVRKPEEPGGARPGGDEIPGLGAGSPGPR